MTPELNTVSSSSSLRTTRSGAWATVPAAARNSSYGPLKSSIAPFARLPNVEVATQEPASTAHRKQNYLLAEELAEKGKQFRNVIEWKLCWYFENATLP
jgi:hypothetical protein